jgi:hypothetical protein
MKKLILLSIIFVGLYACSIPVDPIYPQGFSATELSFGADGGSAIITSQRDEWCFDLYCDINETIAGFPRCEDVFIDIYSQNNRAGVCSDSVLTVTYDIMNKRLEAVKIENFWFQVIKETPKQINFIIEPNLTGYSRKFQLYIGDKMGTSIIVTQSAE